MKPLQWIATALFLLGATSVAMASNGLILGNAGPGGESAPALETLQEEWNAAEPHFPVGTYVGGCFGWPYNPSHDYLLERVEFLAGGVAGQVYVQIRSGDLNGPVMGEAIYNEVSATGWQGSNLAPAVPVENGTTVYLIYFSLPNGNASTAASGTPNTYYFGGDCTNYNGPFDTVSWKVRFYGSQAVPVEASTWGQIKDLYN